MPCRNIPSITRIIHTFLPDPCCKCQDRSDASAGPHPGFLRFLTTPVAYLESIPRDPYTSSTLKSPYDTTPIILRCKVPPFWEDKPLEHDGWAAFSIGPSMQIPPEYEISALRRVPYESHNLSKFLYDPSNGLIAVDSFIMIPMEFK